MKSFTLSILAGAAMIGSIAVWNHEATAQTAAADSGKVVAVAEVPLNCRCIVTLDPDFKMAQDTSSQTQKNPGFTSAYTAEGVLVRMDSEWVVLRDGASESWIPKEKVLLIQASR